MGRYIFGKNHLRFLKKSLYEAERRVLRHSSSLFYEIDISPGDHLKNDVYADILKCVCHRSYPIRHTFDFYKIVLYEDHILSKVKRHNLSLFHFVLYILTHELIHIKRFSTFPALFYLQGDEKEEEEKLVHRLTFLSLKDIKDERMNRVFSVFFPLLEPDIAKVALL